MNIDLTRRRRGLLGLFLVPGLVFASWVTRTPEIRTEIDASIAEMGMVLFGLSVGAIIGVLGAGNIVNRYGTKFVAVTGLILVSGSMIMLVIGVAAGSQVLTASGLALFGLGAGLADIAINMDAGDMEVKTGQHLLHILHGFFSLGTLLGALIALVMIALKVSLIYHLAFIGVVIIPTIVILQGGIPPGAAKNFKVTSSTAEMGMWRDPRMASIAFLAFSMAMAEGAANDWLPILVVDEHGFSVAAGSFAFMAFALAMTIGRLSGGVFLKRFSIPSLARASALLVSAGLILIVVAESDWLVCIAITLWGAGTSLGFPLALSWAGQLGGNAVAQVKAVAIVGYVALLVAPPGLGFIGEVFGLRTTMLVVLSLILIAIPLCRLASLPKQ